MSLKTRAQWLSWAEAELKSAATQQPRAEAEFLLAAADYVNFEPIKLLD